MPIVEDLNTEIAKIHPDAFLTIEEHKKQGFYFWLQSVTEVRPDGHVTVEGYGDMIMLGSYSYLGLNQHPRITQAAKEAVEKYGTGTHGSRMLAGTLDVHNRLERKIAEFKHTEAAITFSTGYVTNIAAISTLLKKGDAVICDKLNHASVIDGCLYSQAEFVRFLHNDMKSLENRLKKYQDRPKKLVVVDAVFSMDGDIVNLPEVSRLCRQYGAYLMVDEAHSVGVLGRSGSGIEEYFGMPYDTIDVKMGTLSKAIPSSGGYIAGSADLCTYLKHGARGFVYSGAPSAASAAAAIAAIEVIQEESWRLQKLHENAVYFKQILRKAGFDLGPTQTPIVPIMCYETEKTAYLARYCQRKGLFIHAIYYPTVAKGKARLRSAVLASHSREDLETSARILIEGAKEFGILEPVPAPVQRN
jgi:glycine C-acetyltransferase